MGPPIANTKFYVLDRYNQSVPIGVPGELYIGGDGVALGYLNRPELTGERFVTDPFGDERAARMYKTGDLVRYLPDGHLEFLGRLDYQVKIRGFRVELGEIEAVLRRHPEVEDAAVVALANAEQEKQLVAYVTAEGSAPPTPGSLRDVLRQQLPTYMIPRPSSSWTRSRSPPTVNSTVRPCRYQAMRIGETPWIGMSPRARHRRNFWLASGVNYFTASESVSTTTSLTWAEIRCRCSD